MTNDECGMTNEDEQKTIFDHPLFETFHPRIRRLIVEEVKMFPETKGSLFIHHWLQADLAVKIEELTKAINHTKLP